MSQQWQVKLAEAGKLAFLSRWNLFFLVARCDMYNVTKASGARLEFSLALAVGLSRSGKRRFV